MHRKLTVYKSRENKRTFDVFIDPAMSIDTKDNDPGQPGGFCQGDSYSNPFNPLIVSLRTSPHRSHAQANVRRAQGQVVTVTADEVVSAGGRSFVWDNRDTQGNAAKGSIYRYSIMTDTLLISRKTTLVK